MFRTGRWTANTLSPAVWTTPFDCGIWAPINSKSEYVIAWRLKDKPISEKNWQSEWFEFRSYTPTYAAFFLFIQVHHLCLPIHPRPLSEYDCRVIFSDCQSGRTIQIHYPIAVNTDLHNDYVDCVRFLGHYVVSKVRTLVFLTIYFMWNHIHMRILTPVWTQTKHSS